MPRADIEDAGPPPGVEMGRGPNRNMNGVMITREWLDEHIPVDACLPLIATLSAIKYFGVAPGETDVDNLEWILEQFSKFVERDWHYPWSLKSDPVSCPSWLKVESPDYDSQATSKMWNISIRGLVYKQRSNYLTAEGWPCGTTCWFITVDHGWKEHVAGLTPMAAALRTMVFVGALVDRRKYKPGTEPQLTECIRRLAEEA